MTVSKLVFVALVAGLVAACGSEPTAVAPAAPVEVTDEATGHYCGMLLADHQGPKGQVHLASRDEPIWFSSVRDTIAFTRLPEEPKDITAIYVNDMGRAQSWQQPEAGTWTEAREAWFVIGSDRLGGMGAPEAVPFSEQDAAEAFRASQGGTLVRFDDIPESYVLGPVELDDPAGAPGDPSHGSHSEESSHTGQSSHSGH